MKCISIVLTASLSVIFHCQLAPAGGPKSGQNFQLSPGSRAQQNFYRLPQGSALNKPAGMKPLGPGSGHVFSPLNPVTSHPFQTKPLTHPVTGGKHPFPGPIQTLPGKGPFQQVPGVFPQKFEPKIPQGGKPVPHNDFQTFCKHHAQHCHWWFQYSPHLRTQFPTAVHWRHCRPTVIVDGRPVVSKFEWYFGMKGLILPGQGIGVESVEPGSPAALANLQPGTVMLSANGIPLHDAEAMNLAIARSNGLLTVQMIAGEGAPPETVTVQLMAVQTASF